MRHMRKPLSNSQKRPDWILGLMQIANILHLELFSFNMKSLADEFYDRFLGVRLSSVRHGRSLAHPAHLSESQPPSA